jgi:DNA/RNA-binding domain of Phe-tRNA-synthetase-like protein
VVFSDEAKLVVARRWCWRQSDQSAARAETTDVIITVEAHHARGRHDVQAAVDELVKLLSKYAGGTSVSGILDALHPVLSS